MGRDYSFWRLVGRLSLGLAGGDPTARARGRLAESIRVRDVALNNVTLHHVVIRVALNGVGPDVAPLDDVGPDVAPLDDAGPDAAPLDGVGPDVVPLDESDRGKELTAFEALDHGTAVEPGAAGRAVILTAEKSR
jgi:hypothetical protein